MNDDKNTPQPQPWIDPALEARIVALVLGETSAFEAAELERLLSGNRELATFKRRIEAAHNLVGVAGRPENPKLRLSPERRRKLLETISVPPAVAPEKKVRVAAPRRPAWRSPHFFLRIAACLIMTTLVLVIFSSINVFQNTSEPPSFEGESGAFASASFTVSVDELKAGRAANRSEAEIRAQLRVNPLAADAKPKAPPAMERQPKQLAMARQQPAGLDEIRPLSESLPQEEVREAQSEGRDGTPLPSVAGAKAEEIASGGETAQAMTGFESADKKANIVVARSQLVRGEKLAGGQTGFADTSQTIRGDAEKSQTGVLPDRNEPTIASEYLNGAPESDLVAKAKPADGWDSLYMFRGVNVLAAQNAETKPLPTEVADQIAKSLPDDQGAAVTSGERSASCAIGANSVDALLAGTHSNPISAGVRNERVFIDKDGHEQILEGRIDYGAPIFAAGTYTEDVINQPIFSTKNIVGEIAVHDGQTVPQGKLVTDNKPADLVSSPAVTTKSGQLASTQVVREFEYPSEFQPPSTPSVPRMAVFSTPDGKVEFVDGFINYGSPIKVVPNEEQKAGQKKYLVEEGQKFSETGRYDLAIKRYEQALEIDPYDISARQRMEQVNEVRARMGLTASNESRRDMVRSVDKGWELPVRKSDVGATTIIAQPQLDQRGTAIINRKLDEIVIPRIDFQNVTVREAIDFLKQRASTLDRTETDSARKGINIVLNLPENAAEADAKITLGLTDIPLRGAIDHVAKAANLKLKIEPYAVSVVPQSVSTEVLITKEYKVPPGFIPAPPAAPGKPISGAKEYLESAGVTFPPGATAYYLAGSNKLIIKNTQSNLDLVDSRVETQNGSGGSPSRPSTAGSENPPYLVNETPTARQPVSTFSLHVSDVSFQLAKDALAKGTMPDPARIRPEEFYNAFDYNDPAPGLGEEVACRIEQCAHPFLQQRNLVRIAVRAAASGRAAGQPLRLTILLDTSGSMEREDRAVSVRRALQTLTTLLGPNDRVTLIGFARTPRLLAEQVPGDQAGKLIETADHTPSEGGTNLEEALALASEMALKQKLPAAQNRIVLLTDGAANLGNADPVRLAKQIEKTRQQGISFDACGVGANGLNDEMLEALTRKGDGRYYFLNKPEEAGAGFAKQLAGAFRPAAENVKVQVVFNPARAAKYRLIGFEKHLLKKEDFRNDKVQAAELSAEEAGVALYQIEALPEGGGDLGQVFVRFRDPATGEMVERSWTMPYEAQVRSFDQASPSLQLAATAALLAEKLQGSAQVDLDPLKSVLANLRGHYPHQTRVRELLQMFERLKQ